MNGVGALTGIYQGVVQLKNYLYDQDYIRAVELPVPVISIGNLTVGGTGKTPLTDFCLKYYLRKKIKIAVISRNYRAQVQEIARVDLDRTDAAKFYGDEPVWLAEKNPEVAFFVGPKKYLTAQFALKNQQPELILIDDGFQHRRLQRDLDLVVLDATETLENYRCLPSGRARESFQALHRASALLISKTNLASAKSVQELVSRLKSEFKKPVFCFEYQVARLVSAEGSKTAAETRGRRSFLISGLARPESFEVSLQAFGMTLQHHQRFADHYQYLATDVKNLVQRWQELDQPDLITTEKDFVKLKKLWPPEVPLWVAPLEVRLTAQEDLFYEILDQVLH
jgi:tetraacyldisaccharide 4'-kinase